jgi:hypothetical protein
MNRILAAAIVAAIASISVSAPAQAAKPASPGTGGGGKKSTGGGSTGGTTPLPTDIASLPLVQSFNMVYEGAFRFPNLPYTGNACDGITYGGDGIAFNPAGNGGQGSLFAIGNTYCGRIGEFSIPAVLNRNTIGELQYATLIQVQPGNKIVDATEGTLATSGITGGTHTTVNGVLVYKGNLAISAGNHYSTVPQLVSHWTRPLNLGATGQVIGPMPVQGDRGYTNIRFAAGYMCHIPTNLQALLGGPAITGWVADSIASNASNGPAAFALDPDKLKTGTTVIAPTLLAYPLDFPLQQTVSGETQALWNWTSTPRGCAVPDGTRSVLFWGRHGTGAFQYGTGGANGHTNTGTIVPIYDPADNSTGEHAWPYRYKVWAYDAADLAKVKNGEIQAYAPRPYATWIINMPLENLDGNHVTGGMAYDPRTGRLFVVQGHGGAYGEPVIQVFKVNNALLTTPNY